MVKEMTTPATEVLTDHMYRDRPEEGNLEHDGETFDKQAERPLLEAIEFALAVAASLDHRPPGVAEVSVHPLLPKNRDECGQRLHEQTCVEEV